MTLAEQDKFSNIDLVNENYDSIIEHVEFLHQNSKAEQQLALMDSAILKLYEEKEKVVSMISLGKAQIAFSDYENSFTPVSEELARLLGELGDFESVQAAQIFSETKTMRNFSVVILSLAVLTAVAVASFLGKFISRSIARPLKEVSYVAEGIAQGEFDRSFNSIDANAKDEISAMAATFSQMQQQLVLIIGDLQTRLANIGNGDFSDLSEHKQLYYGEYAQLDESCGQLLEELNKVIYNIKLSANMVNSGSDQVSAAAGALSEGAAQQASSIEQLSSTMAEVSDKIKANAERANIASELSSQAGTEVIESDEKMRELTLAMEDISEKSAKISRIIKTIDDIAFQTNILALNAAVEAARAGNAGRGFSVVADEVRNLAQKSADAAKNTTELIGSAISAINNGAKLTQQTASSLKTVAEKTAMVNEHVSEISRASCEQAEAVIQVTQGIDQISAVVQTNSATAQQSAAASEELLSQANSLRELVSQFKIRENQEQNV